MGSTGGARRCARSSGLPHPSATRWERRWQPRRRWPAPSPSSKPSQPARQPARLSALLRVARLGRKARALRRFATRRAQSESTRRALSDYLAAARQVAEFSVYERVFSLWHAFHLPLCFLLFTATLVHVIAAHLY